MFTYIRVPSNLTASWKLRQMEEEAPIIYGLDFQVCPKEKKICTYKRETL